MEVPSAGWNLLTHATFSARNHAKGTSMEHSVNDNAVYGRGVQIFAAGDNCCAVCAPAILCEKEIESAAARGEPRGPVRITNASLFARCPIARVYPRRLVG